MARRRYQRGALRREGKNWILRWREDVLNKSGAVVRVERRVRVGTTKDLPTKALARRVADRMVEHVKRAELHARKGGDGAGILRDVSRERLPDVQAVHL